MENQARTQPAMLGERRAAHSTAFKKKLEQMALPLAPLVQLTTGEVHPAFPGTLLNFWLLTDAELEALAHFYHQRTPCRYTFHYPCPINVSLSLSFFRFHSLSLPPPHLPLILSSHEVHKLTYRFFFFSVVLRHADRREASENRTLHRAPRLRDPAARAHGGGDRRRRPTREGGGGGGDVEAEIALVLREKKRGERGMTQNDCCVLIINYLFPSSYFFSFRALFTLH